VGSSNTATVLSCPWAPVFVAPMKLWHDTHTHTHTCADPSNTPTALSRSWLLVLAAPAVARFAADMRSKMLSSGTWGCRSNDYDENMRVCVHMSASTRAHSHTHTQTHTHTHLCGTMWPPPLGRLPVLRHPAFIRKTVDGILFKLSLHHREHVLGDKVLCLLLVGSIV